MSTDTDREEKFDWRAASLAWRLGYTIAIPLVVLAIGGRLLDKRLDTHPLFLLAGILLSMIVSTIAIIRIVVPILRELSEPGDHKPDRKA